MTFLFAAGVATVILPIALGASLVRQILSAQHTLLYVVGGLVMLGFAIYTLLGGQMNLPAPGHRTGGRTGVLGVYSLGIFSGMASSCCAPVLAGVIALSSLAASFWLALGLGVAYVFGMVAPLFVISLLWERYRWRSSGLFKHHVVSWHIGRLERTVTVTNLLSGVLLLLIGGAMIWVGLAGVTMATTGWQAQFTLLLQHVGRVITTSLSWAPGWVVGLVLVLVIGLLAWRALRQIGPDGQEAAPLESPEEAMKEAIVAGTKEKTDD
jgi:cytochrome c biogenesis protein CcdA